MIVFKAVRWKNILSTGNVFTEIELNRSKNTLIIGPNGSGKSTLLDVLCFALFGKPFRKINKPTLINSVNQSDGVAEVEFSIGRKEYKVVRGLKPNIFEIYCNDELINQDAKSRDYQEHLEKNILKLNYKSFTQVVILGSAAFVPFMQLSAADRRAIIEDLLDIGIFSSMNLIVKTKLSEIKDKQKDNEYETKLTQEKINLQIQNIEENKKNSATLIDAKFKEFTENEQHIAKLEKDIELIQGHVDILQRSVSDASDLVSKSKKFLQIETKFDSNLSKFNKEINFYDDNDSCPTCLQVIDKQFKETQVQEKKSKVSELKEASLKLKGELRKLSHRQSEIAKIQSHISEHLSEIVRLNAQLKSTKNYNARLDGEIIILKKASSNLEDGNVKLKDLRENLDKLVEDAKTLAESKQYYEFSASLLKDTGIKTKIIRQYLPIMNKIINKNLAAMDFFVNFNLNENFEETIKSRHRDEFSYASFSEGEKQKIDLSLLFAWRQVAKMKNSINTNLLILDEVFDSSLDAAGVELLMSILKDLPENTNTFVISHKGDALFDKFRHTIKFSKKGNFSVIE